MKSKTEKNEAKKEFELLDAEIIRETERAAQVKVTIETAVGQKGWKVWFPKSQIRIEGERIFAQEWIIAKKNDEIRDYFDERNGGFYFVLVR